MKKLMCIAVLLLGCSTAFSQTYYYKHQRKKDFSFQVAPTVATYGDNPLYGFSLGVNFKEVFNFSYFHTRDYKSKEGSYMDTRWAGLYTAIMLPVNDCFQVGPTFRMAALDAQFEKPYFGVEGRVNLAWNTKLGFEYGKSNERAMSVKLIWNIY
ncbi:hypothetical protein [Roseivirga sp. UBA838]|uniref:hypothetical protein n=1 Tax=Roseivirga sp. UBA838 TaxID=1947393 RepID=UPI00257D3827|nr:hypothetical protein [Roseivirga sp. UBA838]|tara:strand:+ start:24553 stop:25014 length:462 start_codon:yes stop_codon:yes gene_type:complete